jgi:hypothetical protein
VAARDRTRIKKKKKKKKKKRRRKRSRRRLRRRWRKSSFCSLDLCQVFLPCSLFLPLKIW